MTELSDVVGVVGSALTVIGSLVGGGVLLIKMNYKQGRELLATKKDLYQERFENLKAATESLQKSLTFNEKKLEDTTQTLLKTSMKLEETKKQMVEYVEVTEKKLSRFESVTIKLSEDLLMIKNKKGPE